MYIISFKVCLAIIIYTDYNNDKNETKTEEIYIQQIDKQIPLISIHLLC